MNSNVTSSSKIDVGTPTSRPRNLNSAVPQSSANQHQILRPGPSRPIGLPETLRGRRTTAVKLAGSPSLCSQVNENTLSSQRICSEPNVVSLASIQAKYGWP